MKDLTFVVWNEFNYSAVKKWMNNFVNCNFLICDRKHTCKACNSKKLGGKKSLKSWYNFYELKYVYLKTDREKSYIFMQENNMHFI